MLRAEATKPTIDWLRLLRVAVIALGTTAIAMMALGVRPAAAAAVTVPVDGNPLDVVVTTDGTTAYVLVSDGIPDPTAQDSDSWSSWVVPVDLTTSPPTAGSSFSCTDYWGDPLAGVSLALAPDQQTLYGSDADEGFCAMDLTASPVSGNFLDTPGLTPGGGMVVRPDGGVLYATNPRSDDAIALDLEDVATRIVLRVDRGPVNLGITPDGGTLLVANNNAYYISVIDTQTEEVTATVDVNTRGVGSPAAIAVANDGTYAYITLTGGYGNKCKGITGQLAKYNIGTQTVEASIDVGECPTDVAISPDGSRALVTNTESDTLSQIDLATFTNVATDPIADGPTAVAFNPDGQSALVSNAGAKVLTVLPMPAAPTDLTWSLNGQGQVVLDFTAPDGNGTQITNYAVAVDGQEPIAREPAQVAPPLTLANLPTYQESAVTVAAINGVGVGAESKPIKVTPAGPPPPPEIVQITPGAGSLSVDFTQPLADAANVTNYAYSLDGGPFWPYNPARTTSPLPIDSLVSGQTYEVRLAAINAFGTGIGSLPVSGTPFALPAAPAVTGVMPGDPASAVTVTPGADGGTPITNYAYSLNGAQPVVLDPPQTTSPLQIPGLPTNTSYSLAVAAINEVGRSELSPVVNPGPPAAPGAPFVNQLGNPATVTFSQTPNSLTPITNYQYAIDGQAPIVLDPAQTASPLQIPGLPDFDFDLTLQAINDFGPSQPSTTTYVGTPPTPTNVTVVNADPAGAVVQFTLDPYATSLTNVRYRINGGAWTNLSPPQPGVEVGPGQLQITMPSQSQSYIFELQAVNPLGGGPASSSAQVTLPPPAPTAVIGLPGDASAQVYVDQPSAGSVTPLTNFEYTLDGGTSFVALDPAQTTSPFTISGLTNGQPYFVGVRAVSTGGTSPVTYVDSAVTPGGGPPAPTDLVATPGNKQLSIAFGQENTTGAEITNYIVSLVRQGSDVGVRTFALNPAQATSPIVIGGLVNGSEYAVALSAVNADGPGAASSPVTGIPLGTPNEPTGVTLTPVGSGTEVGFQAPTDGGFPITNYQYSVNGGEPVVLNPAQTTSPLTIPSLPVGSSLTIAAINSAGAGPASAAVTAEVPQAPTNLFVSSLGAVSEVEFAQFNLGTTPMSNYLYSVNGATPVALDPAQTSSPLAIPGLPLDTTFTLKLFAQNGFGTSTASQSISVGIPPAPVIAFAKNTAEGTTISYQVPQPTQPLLNVEYQIDSGDWVAFAPPTVGVNNEVVVPLQPQTYQLAMRLVNGSGTGPASAVITVPIFPPPPIITQAILDGDQIYAYFNQPGDSGSPITKYQYAVGDDWYDTGGSTTSPLAIPTEFMTAPYEFRIRAVNVGGSSLPSNAFTPLAGLTFQPMDPLRVWDTRTPDGGGVLNPGQPRTIDLSSLPGLPVNTTAVAFNVTATGQTASGYLAVTPDVPQEIPAVSTVNWTAPQQTVANAFVSKIGGGNTMSVTLGGTGTSQALIDVLGYFAPVADQPNGATYTSVAPQRVYDSRGPDAGGPLPGGQTRIISLAPALPPGAVGAEVNLTITGTKGTGYLSVRPEDTPQTNPTSLINWAAPDQTLAAGALTAVGPDLDLHLRAGGQGATEIVVDVRGYFMPGEDGSLFYSMTPERQYDSRLPNVGGGPILGDQQRTNTVLRVPADATAAAINLTITGTQRSGFLNLRGANQPAMRSSVINWTADNQTRANGTTTPLANLQFITSTQTPPGSTQYLYDIGGFYYTPPRPPN